MRKTAMAVAAALVLAACGGSSMQADAGAAAPPTTTAPPTTLAATTTTTAAPTTTAPPPVTTGFPTTVTHASGEVVVQTRPEAIVSMSATATEILFAVGAGEQVIAVDLQSNYPEEAPPGTLNAFEPSVEAIAGLEPDLVIMSYDPGDVASGLAALSIPVVMQFPAVSLVDAYDQIEQLGAASGNPAAAAELVAEIRTTVEDLNEVHAARPEPLTYYHELDGTFYSVTSSTFIGELYSVFGLENIADPADSEGYGYPQLSPEFILEADPDLIFLADTKCCSQSAATLAARPGWDQLSAVQAGNVIELDDDVASRWGPRIVDLLTTIVAAIERYDATGSD